MLTSPAFCRQGRGLGLNNSVSRLDILTICLGKIFKCAINVTGDRRWHCLINTMTEVTHWGLWLGFTVQHASPLCVFVCVWPWMCMPQFYAEVKCRGTLYPFLLPSCLFRVKSAIWLTKQKSVALTHIKKCKWQLLCSHATPEQRINATEESFPQAEKSGRGPDYQPYPGVLLQPRYIHFDLKKKKSCSETFPK